MLTHLKKYTRLKYLEWIISDGRYKIPHLEFLAIIVALKLWKVYFKGKRFVIKCDYQAVVDIISAGTRRDSLLQDILREFTFVCATGQMEVVARHVMGISNEVPDILSRYHLHAKYRKKFTQYMEPDWVYYPCSESLLRFSHDW